MKTHKDLGVWKFSIELVTMVFHFTSNCPKDEIFGLTNQMRRTSVSLPSIVAEGAARKSEKEFIQFLCIALGSQQELDTLRLIALT